MKSIVRDYLRQLKMRLQCPRAIRKPFLQQMETELEDFCARNDTADATLLAQAFGSPEDLAQEFLSELSADAVASSIRARRRALLAAISVLLLIAGTVRFFTLYAPPQTVENDALVAIVRYAQADEAPDAQMVTNVFVATDGPEQGMEDIATHSYDCILYYD